jgi:hypothetical protein
MQTVELNVGLARARLNNANWQTPEAKKAFTQTNQARSREPGKATAEAGDRCKSPDW